MRRLKIKKILSLVIVSIFIFSAIGTVAEINQNNIQSYKSNSLDDTTPPDVRIISPEVGFLYAYLFERQFKIHVNPPYLTLILGKIDIEVDAIDDSGIDWVKFYIDNELKATVNETPYVWSWDEECLFFSYIVKVVACDCAGNENSTQIKLWKLQLFV